MFRSLLDTQNEPLNYMYNYYYYNFKLSSRVGELPSKQCNLATKIQSTITVYESTVHWQPTTNIT